MLQSEANLAEKTNQDIVPGTPAAVYLVAEQGGVGAKILQYIVKEGEKLSMRYKLHIGPWTIAGEDYEARGCVEVEDKKRYVVLRMGSRDGLRNVFPIVEERSCTSTFSPGETNVRVGNLPEEKIRNAAQQTIAAVFVHGKKWKNRKGEVILCPFGPSKTAKRRRRR